MRLDELGDPKAPTILMVPGSFCTGDSELPIARRLCDRFHVVTVTLDGHVKGGGDYLSKEASTEGMVSWLHGRGIDHLAMAHGTSMGAINVLDVAREGSVSADVWFYDGGPFFDLPRPVETLMRRLFRRVLGIGRRRPDGTPWKIDVDKVLGGSVLRHFLGDDAPMYREILDNCAEVCTFVSDATLTNECRTFCECRLPELPPDVVRRSVFVWGSKESARASRKRVQSTYPDAEFIDAEGYNHCGLQCVKPDEYARLLSEKIAQGRRGPCR